MTYDTSGIQQEGGQGHLGQEESFWTGESRKGKRGPQGQERFRPIVACKCCGKSFVIPPGASLKKKFCSFKCSGNGQRKTALANEKRKCMTCHALIGMTGAASGRMVNLPKGVICVFRNKSKLPVFSRSQAAVIAAARLRGRPLPWWGDLEVETAWMSQIRVKDFDWSSVWKKELARRKALNAYRNMTHEERRQTWINRVLTPQAKINKCATTRKWKRERMASDPVYRVIATFRSRLSVLVRNKGTTTKELIGCTQDHLRSHLESKFKKGMSWKNYGEKWHVDHVIPVSSFDHSCPKQLRQCWHWTNLEPLGASDNMSKGARITRPQMSLLI